MGLDISYYKNARLIKAAEFDEEDNERIESEHGDEAVHCSPNPDFPHASEMVSGYYLATCVGGFRAGSYGGYSAWREQLSQMFLGVPAKEVWGSFEDFKGKPFAELVNFSDCEGVISGPTAVKLAVDFASHRPALSGVDAAHFSRVYDDFATAFAVAANGGFVDFH